MEQQLKREEDKKYILILVGHQGVGKTECLHRLDNDKEFSMIKFFTTREKNNKDDNDYIFCRLEDLNILDVENIIEKNGEYYGMLKSELQKHYTDQSILCYCMASDANRIAMYKWIEGYETFIFQISCSKAESMRRCMQRDNEEFDIEEFEKRYEEDRINISLLQDMKLIDFWVSSEEMDEDALVKAVKRVFNLLKDKN